MQKYLIVLFFGMTIASIGAIIFGDIPNPTLNQYIGMLGIMIGYMFMGYSISIPKEKEADTKKYY